MHTRLSLISLIIFSSYVCSTRLYSGSEENSSGEYPIYPFQQYIQVRKSYSYEHLPKYGSAGRNGDVSSGSGLHPSEQNLATAATTNGESYHSHQNHPRLTEEIQTWGKQEVYEEKGYTDSEYDHHKNSAPQSDESHPNDYYAQPTKVLPRYETLPDRDADGSSSRLLAYAASVLYDRDAHQHGIYKARSGIICPDVINFDLSSNSMKMGKGQDRPPGKPRLSGLGSKIRCLRKKYFGDKPFPEAIFKHPEESQRSLINEGSMEQFLKDFKKNIPS